jgi:sugar/nucleoside kinase (ribokinase family)
MPNTRFDVVGIGNAIVDILAQADDAFLVNEQIAKGNMTLIDEDRAAHLFGKMGTTTTMSGGSAGNTVAGLAALGGRAAYIGKIRDDQMGAIFAHDMKALGVHFDTPPATSGPRTASCLIFITPDGQRSMNTYLGACVDLSTNELDEAAIRDSQVTYLEGYLFDKPAAKEAFYVSAGYAHKHGRKVALTLSDPFCVNRHRQDFQRLVSEQVEILFANEAEACALYKKENIEDALPVLANMCELAVVTLGDKGSIILHQGERIVIDAKLVGKIVDTTGAGDLYAAGFLYGYTADRDLQECGRIASLAAAEVISHVGSRPQQDLRKLIA